MMGKRAFRRRALRRPHPAWREVTWRHWYGLTQAWGRTTYDWTLWQILPRVGRRTASRVWQRALSKIRHGFTIRETLPWKNTHMGLPEGNQAIWTPSPVQGLTGDPGELTPELGLASDCSAQSDCWGCWRNSTRVRCPRNWTGGGKRCLNPRVKGNGAASVTSASSSRQLPVTQHTGRNWHNVETVESSEGVRWCPARSSTDICHRGAVRKRIWTGNTPSGVSPHPKRIQLALRLVHQGDGIHYPVGQPQLGNSLPFLLTSVANKELLRVPKAPGTVHVYAQCSWWAAIAAKYTFKVEGDSLRSNLSCRKKALLSSCTFGGFLHEKNTSSRTDSTSVHRLALLKEL